MINYYKSSTRVLQCAFLALVIQTYGISNTSEAGLLLNRLGSDLVIEVQNPINFKSLRSVTNDRFGFILPGAIDVGGTGGFGLRFEEATAPSLLGEGIVPPALVTTGPRVGLIRGGPDLEISFASSRVTVLEGEKVLLTPGSLTLPGFFAFSIIRGLNYSAAETVFLSVDGARLSAATPAIPEPSTTYLILISCSVSFYGFAARFFR